MSRPVRQQARAANRTAKWAAGSPAYKWLARAGYVLRAFLYGFMGFLALRIAFTGVAQNADQQTSLLAVAGIPFGRLVLVAGIVFLAAYALWGFIRAIYDPLGRGDDATGIATRVAFGFSGFAYLGLTLFAIGLLTHGGNTKHPDEVQQFASRILSAPAGIVLAEVAGLVAIAGGIGQLVEAYRATFQKDLKRRQMSRNEERITRALGQFGFLSRGLVFILMGWFIVLAALQHNAKQARGFSAIFAYLLTQPYGRPLLAVLAIGFIALGLHSLALARYIRLPGDPR